MAERPAQRRCAIYARKSSEEGLDMSYNTLEAQRDACSSYIASQRHEGWKVVNKIYEDGGYSGGNLQRPGLKELLDDVAKGLIDIIVVYKIDRLTRSLTDFAKLTDLLDKHQVSFVAVTQQFNTSTSMGRLTLNVLLSFAQFEREVSGERIRDKFAASKRKGIWMGGPVPMGYDARDRKLHIIEEEAEIVQHIFRRYLQLRSVHLLQKELAEQGVRSRIRTSKTGNQLGGKVLGRGAIGYMLRNLIYIGIICQGKEHHQGEHEAIIADDVFERVQQVLTNQSPGEEAKIKRGTSALLKGLVFDSNNGRLLPTHCNKKGQRYHYYTSEKRLRNANQDPEGLRVPAADLDQLVTKAIASKLTNDHWLAENINPKATDIPRLIQAAKTLAEKILDKNQDDTQPVLKLIERIIVEKSRVSISLNKRELLLFLNYEEGHERAPESETLNQNSGVANGTLQIIVQSHLLRCGKQMKLILGTDTSGSSALNPQLVNLVVQAKRWFAGLSNDKYSSLSDLAKGVNLDKSYVSRVITLAFLAPDILEKIITGDHSHLITPERLRKACPLPLHWEDQRALLQV
jgi:site-specific DNA recombinase